MFRSLPKLDLLHHPPTSTPLHMRWWQCNSAVAVAAAAPAPAISCRQGEFNNQQGREAATEGSGVGTDRRTMMVIFWDGCRKAVGVGRRNDQAARVQQRDQGPTPRTPSSAAASQEMTTTTTTTKTTIMTTMIALPATSNRWGPKSSCPTSPAAESTTLSSSSQKPKMDLQN